MKRLMSGNPKKGFKPLIWISVLLFILAASCTISCRSRKSDPEQILDALNRYLEAHSKGDFEKSYKYLAPETQKEISERDWVTEQLKSINSARLMRDPRLTNVVVMGAVATADFHFQGIPPETLTSILSQIYSKNFHLPFSEINKAGEEYLNEHFNEISAPQMMALTFVKTGKGWRLLLDAKGRPRALH